MQGVSSLLKINAESGSFGALSMFKKNPCGGTSYTKDLGNIKNTSWSSSVI
jgi:hypothetical protein